MSEIISQGSGKIPSFGGVGIADLFELINANGTGKIPAFGGLGVGNVLNAGDVNSYINIYDIDLAGIKFFDQGPGFLVVGGCEKSKKVVMIDPTGVRSLQLESESVELNGEINGLRTTDTHVFVYVTRQSVRQRFLHVLKNESGLELVATFELDQGDEAAWLALENEANIVAYPKGIGRVEVRRTTAPFDVFDSVNAGGNSALAQWFRFMAVERPLDPSGDIEKLWYLYVVSKEGAEADVIEFRFFDNMTTVTESLRKHGTVNLEGAQRPIRLGFETCSTLRNAAVTPREPITPVFEGVYEVSDGFFATVWGYINPNFFIVDQPFAETGLTRNHFVAASAEQQALLPELLVGGVVETSFIVFTNGEELIWELETQAGGGRAITDYSVILDPLEVNALSAFLVRQLRPSFIRYGALTPLEITRINELDLGRVTLNNAGVSFDRVTVVRHTKEPNDDIPNQSKWYSRDLACRIEGGAIQAHADAARISRILVPAIAPELARGYLFDLPLFNYADFPVIKLTDAIAQQNERMGWDIGMSADSEIVALSADDYTDGSFTNLGRIIVWKKDDIALETATHTSILEPPPDWVRANSMQFGRFTEVNPAGDLLFISGKKGPGVAVYNIDALGVATYWKTLIWAGYTAIPDGEKGHEARFSADGNTFILSTGAFSLGTATVAAQVFILQTTDDWETFSVVQTITRPAGAGADVFNALDTSTDASVLAVANWQLNQVYVFRTSDNWATFSTYTFTNPAEYTFGVNDDSSMGISMGVSSDGFRVFVGAPDGNVDYGAGVVTNVGSVEQYLFNADTNAYVRVGRVVPPDVLPTNAFFGRACRFNAPGSRIAIVAKGFSKLYVYGIHIDENKILTSTVDVFFDNISEMKWAGTADTLLVSNRLGDGAVDTQIGAFKYLDFAEAP